MKLLNSLGLWLLKLLREASSKAIALLFADLLKTLTGL